MPSHQSFDFSVVDGSDNTKRFAFDASLIATDTTRTLKAPNISGTLSLIDGAQTWSALQTFKDTTLKIVGTADATKTLIYSLGGAVAGADLTLAWSGTADRTVTLPNATGTVIVGSASTQPAGGALLYGAGTTTGMTALAGGSTGDVLTFDVAPQWSSNASVVDIVRTWASAQRFPDDKFSVVGSADATKIAVFEVDGFTTGTTRTFTLPNVSGTVALTSDLPTVDAARTWATLQKFPDDKFQVIGSVDATKVLALEVDGIAAATTRTWTAQNASGTVAFLADVPTVDAIRTWLTQQTFNTDTAGGPLVLQGDPSGINNLLQLKDAVSGFSSVFTMPAGGGFSAARTIEVPDASGTMVLAVATQTFSNKTLGTTANTLRSNSSSSGVAFVDNTTTTKLLRMVLSGAVGSNTFTVANVAARDYKFGDDTGTMDAIVAPSSATVNLTGKTASVVATTAYTTVHAGFYRLTAYAVFTAVTTPGNLTISAIYTDPQQAQTNAFTGATAYAAAGSLVQGECQFYATTGSVIQFSTTLTGVGTYNVYCRVESLT